MGPGSRRVAVLFALCRVSPVEAFVLGQEDLVAYCMLALVLGTMGFVVACEVISQRHL